MKVSRKVLMVTLFTLAVFLGTAEYLYGQQDNLQSPQPPRVIASGWYSLDTQGDLGAGMRLFSRRMTTSPRRWMAAYVLTGEETLGTAMFFDLFPAERNGARFMVGLSGTTTYKMITLGEEDLSLGLAGAISWGSE